jgi:tetratricopeptide (TPR) repeat protein
MANIVSAESLRRALSDWNKSERLAAHPIRELDVINVRVQALSEPTLQAIAGVVRATILDALLILRQDQKIKFEGYREAVRGEPLLKLHYVEGVPIHKICVEHSISQATYHRYINLELKALSEVLSTHSPAASTTSAQLKQTQLHTPALPAEYLPRQSHINEIVAALTAPTEGNICALVGLPGAGKTTLATDIAGHSVIRQYFPDGVIWMDVGQSGSAERCLREVLEALKPDSFAGLAHPTTEELAHTLHSLLTNRRLLLVIDDVWDLAVAQTLLIGSHISRHLVTTRSPALAYSLAGANVVAINEFTVTEAKDLLMHFLQQGNDAVDLKDESIFPDEALEKMNRLPLTVVLTGRHLRYLQLTRQYQRLGEALHAIDELALPENVDTLDSRIETSLIELGDEASHVAVGLAVFPPKPNTFREHDAVAIAACTANVLNELIDVGLLETWRGRLTMHRAIHDHLRHMRISDLKQAEQRMVRYYIQAFHDGSVFGLEDCANVAEAIRLATQIVDPDAEAELIHSTAWLFEEAGQIDQLSQWVEHAQSRKPVEQHALELSAEAARLTWLHGYTEEAIQQLETCKGEAHRSGFEDVVAECQHTLAYIQVERAQDEVGFTNVDQALKIASPAKQQKLAKKEIAAVRQLVMRSRLDGLRSMMARVVVKLAGKHADRSDVVLAHVVVAWLDYLNGDIETSEARLKAALTSPHTLAHPLIASIANGALARLCCFEGRYTEAVSYALKCIEPATRGASPEFTALAYDVLGTTCMASSNMSDAHRWFDEGLAFTNSHHNPLLKAALLTSKSELHRRQNHLQRAQTTAEAAMQIAELATDPIMRCAAATAVAATASAQGRLEEADLLFSRAREVGVLDTAKANHWSALQFHLHFAQLQLRKQKWRDADITVQTTLALAQQLHAPAYEGRAWFDRAQVALMEGNVENASQFGRRGLEVLTQIGHTDATEVGKWLFENKLTGRAE